MVRASKRSVAYIALLVLVGIRLVTNAAITIVVPNIATAATALIYAVSFWGIYKKRGWGYLVALGFSIVDIAFVALAGGLLAGAFSLGAVAVDLLILILAILEYQKLRKKK